MSSAVRSDMSNELSVLLSLMTLGWSSTTLHGELCSGYVGDFVPSIIDVGNPATNLLFGKRTEPMMAANMFTNNMDKNVFD
ncbi:hypothetical protein DPMN_042260 [Dreissena polymorpha]|uniref:Uncharacterized protein n=1 Tax=Dreissena polymorpha TaxID=45954 RepID=A0A9D4D0J3_DREPO|nr:hypothetical protein DPMN_042260 [Dreissena polymorpha]